MKNPNDRRQHRVGTSLIEVSVCTLLVGMVLVCALETTGGAARTAHATNSQLDGKLAASELLAEMMAMPYQDDLDATFGLESDEPTTVTDRSAFDDLDDYDDWAEATMLANRDGSARSGGDGWTRSATVVKLSADGGTVLSDADPDEGVRRLRVSVTSPAGETTVLEAIRTAYGALEEAPAVAMTLVTGVLVEINTSATSVSDGTSLINHASGP